MTTKPDFAISKTVTDFDPIEFIDNVDWTFAKSYARTSPHEYVVRRQVGDDPWFDAMVRHIRENGRERVWRRKVYIIWYCPDGLRYWTMGWPIAETTIINRGLPHTDETYALREGSSLPYSSPDGRKPEGCLL